MAKFPAELCPKPFSAEAAPLAILDLLSAKIAQKKSEYAATAKSADQTIASLSEQKQRVTVPAGTLGVVQTDIAALRKTASEIRANLSKVGANKAKYDAWIKEKAQVVARDEELRVKLPPGGLKTVKIYQWEMDRVRNEIAKAQGSGDQKMIDFAQKILDGMALAGCDSCPVTMLVKQQIKATKAVDIAPLQEELGQWSELRNLADEVERLDATLTRLANDPRGKLSPEQQSETEQAAEQIAARLEQLQADEIALNRVADLNAAIERTRLGKAEAEDGQVKVKEAEKMLKELRRKFAATIFEPVKAAVDRFLPSGFVVIGIDEGDTLRIGWHLPGRATATPRGSLSGGELAQFEPAFALGLLDLQQLGGQVTDVILTIETAEMSRDNLRRFCAALAETPENVQVIVSTWSDSEVAPPMFEGWETIVLQPVEPVALKEAA